MFEGVHYLRTLFREPAVDEAAGRFPSEASQELFDGAGLQDRVGLMTQPHRLGCGRRAPEIAPLRNCRKSCLDPAPGSNVAIMCARPFRIPRLSIY
jgi:hypothetical protein